VTSASIAPGAVGKLQIADGGVTASALAVGAVTSSAIAAGAVTGATIDPTTSITVNTVTSSDFVFSSAVAGAYIAYPTECHRGLGVGGGAALQDVGVADYPVNVFGPSIGITNSAAGVYDFFCPISVPVPPGATLTVTGASMAFADFSTNCLVGAELRTKAFGSSDGNTGVSISTVYDGANNADFGFQSVGPQTKAFPAFTPFVVSNSTILYVHAFINLTAAASSDCRYSGTRITYTIDRP
jgi:hypothetical protein